MSAKPTPSQALLVWCLVAKQGAAWQADIKPAIEAKDRKALEDMKLLTASKVKGYGNALWLKLDDDRGWGWAAANLDAELPPNYRGLGDLLARLQHHLAHADESLAGFIGAGPDAPEPKAAKTAVKKDPAEAQKAATKRAPAKAKSVDVRAAIEVAYLAVTNGRKGVDAKLSEVRSKLDLPKATVDAALDAIQRGDAKARLMRMDDQRSITAADKQAAFLFAGEPLHILWIMP